MVDYMSTKTFDSLCKTCTLTDYLTQTIERIGFIYESSVKHPQDNWIIISLFTSKFHYVSLHELSIEQ